MIRRGGGDGLVWVRGSGGWARCVYKKGGKRACLNSRVPAVRHGGDFGDGRGEEGGGGPVVGLGCEQAVCVGGLGVRRGSHAID